MSDQGLLIEHLDPAHPELEAWRAVLGLAKKHSGTLGFLPDSAFEDRLRRGTLPIARLEGDVVGYCLYDLPRTGYIKLVHVCVDETARGRSVGKALIDAAVDRNPTAIGVLAYCRRDYQGLDRFWLAAGLTPRGEKAGRAVKGSILSTWWRPLGALDLIEEAALSAGLPLVAYDTNVVSDLYASAEVERPDRESSQGLLAGWLQAAITPVVSPRVDFELNAIDDRPERELQRERSQELIRLRSDQTGLSDLRSRVGEEALRTDPSLDDDLCHVADAIAAGASYLVTNDENLIRVVNRILPDVSPLRIVRPHRLVAEILERLERPVFQSHLIESVDIEWRPAAEWPVEELVPRFVTNETHERAGELTRRIRAALSQHPQSTRVLATPDGRALALVAESGDEHALTAAVLRVARGATSGTIALQLARHLRVIARDSGLHQVRVTDPHPGPVCVEALVQDGYEKEDGFVATLIDRVADKSDFLEPDLSAPAEAHAVREAERRYWPLVLVRTEVPTFLIPVKPGYAELLFGIDRGALWLDRKRALGLSREHVYYSGSGRALPPADARILWYVTSDNSGSVRQVMAYSRSMGCQRLTPEDAHGANSQVGVFTLRHVKGAAGKDGMVTVVRFEDTEILAHPVGGSELSDLMALRGVKHPILSFRSVSPALFDDIARRQPRGVS